MYGNGAGTGTEVIRVRRRRIQRAIPRALTASIAAGAGAIRRRAVVPFAGATTSRITGTTGLVYVWPALSEQCSY